MLQAGDISNGYYCNIVRNCWRLYQKTYNTFCEPAMYVSRCSAM